MSNMPVNPPSWRNDTVLPLPNEVKANAWAVDAACSGNPGPMEYQCIDLQTGAQVFHYGPIHGTNNIGEFLAIVHALALMAQKGITDKVIYSDSVNAQLWVNKKQCKTKLERTPQTEQLYQVIARAENWLRTHPITVPIFKWETKKCGARFLQISEEKDKNVISKTLFTLHLSGINPYHSIVSEGEELRRLFTTLHPLFIA